MKSNLDNFRKYCEKYQDTFGSMYSSEKHDALVKRILQNPKLIGLRGIQFKYKEVRLIGKNKPGRIDLTFITDEEISYICEIKASSKDGRGIETQLERYYGWIRDKFKITPKRIVVQLTKTGKLRKKIIPAEIEDIFQLISKKNLENQI
ncbi:MAG: hypothetical protein ABIH28_00580 [archaeon]